MTTKKEILDQLSHICILLDQDSGEIKDSELSNLTPVCQTIFNQAIALQIEKDPIFQDLFAQIYNKIDHLITKIGKEQTSILKEWEELSQHTNGINAYQRNSRK